MGRPRPVISLAAALLTLSWVAASCTSGPEDSSELVVSAASSLTDAFGELAERFEQDHPGLEVVLNLDSSATLATQVVRGAPVDVFASADARNMADVVDAGLVARAPVELTTNSLVLVTGADEPVAVQVPSDLETVIDEGGVVALCARTAPCGRLADQVLESAGVTLVEDRVTRAPNARGTLGAVTRGDATAALVYASDALAAGDAVSTVTLPPASAASTVYLVVTVGSGTGDPALAESFLEFVASSEGSAVLAAGGFG